MQRILVVLALAAASACAHAQGDVRAAVREWRSANEAAVLAEYFEFLRIPNWAKDGANIERNAALLVRMMERRGIRARLLKPAAGPPVVYGELLVPGALSTYVFYSHYDGQPVIEAEWATPPFSPTLVDGRIDQGGKPVTWPAANVTLSPEWRINARSASDAKAPIMAMLAALSALEAAGLAPRANLKFVFDGEEEQGSPHLAEVLRANQALLAGDLWLICDGPEHSSGRPTLAFGVRGIQALAITVYGASRDLHSGHFGNWAPNAASMLVSLLASMKDAGERVLVKGFHDDATPLSAADREALASLPDTDAEQMRSLGLARTIGGGKTLLESVTRPALTVRGLASGATGDQATSAIPSTATASLEVRLVKGMRRQAVVERIRAHIRDQGYFVVDVEPDLAARRAHGRIARVVVDPAGYDAVRTPIDAPLARRVIAALGTARGPLALIPTMGGSLPLAEIEDVLHVPMINVPTVNFDNNQHAKDENLKLASLWNGIEAMASLLMMP